MSGDVVDCIHGSGGAGGHAGTGSSVPAHQRWAGPSDLGPYVGLPLRRRRHRYAQPGDRGVDRRGPAGRRGRPGLRVDRDVRFDAAGTSPSERLGGAGATESESTPDDTELTKPDIGPVVAEPATELVAPPAGSARIETGSYRCRYAGAMMLFPYMDIVGAQAIFATLTGGPARRYGDLSVLT